LPAAGRNSMNNHHALQDFLDTSQVSLHKNNKVNLPRSKEVLKRLSLHTHTHAVVCRLNRLGFTRRSYSWGTSKIFPRTFSCNFCFIWGEGCSVNFALQMVP
jgi:hypothetical protein